MNQQPANADMKRMEWIFFLLIPIVMIFVAFIYDIGLVYFQEARVKKVTEEIATTVLKNSPNDYYAKVKELYEQEKITSNILDVKFEEETLWIYTSYTYPSFFGRVIGINSYRYEINIKATLNGEEVTIEEVTLE